MSRIFYFLFIIGIFFKSQFIFALNIDVKIGHNDHIVPNHWNPIFIYLDYNIENGRIEISRLSDINSRSQNKEIFYLNKLDKIESTFFFKPEFRYLSIEIYSNKVKIFDKKFDLLGKNFPGNVVVTYNIPNDIQDKISKLLLPDEKIYVFNIEDRDFFSSFFNYDSITGIVLEDPGQILNPIQIDALKQFVASGGRIIFFIEKKSNEGLLPLLINENKLKNDNFKIGLGEVIVINKNISEKAQKDYNWLRKLNLKPFNKNNIALPSNIFKKEIYNNIFDKNKRILTFKLIIFFLTFWLVINIVMIFFLKKKTFIYFISTYFLFIIFSFIIAYFTSGVWQKGVNIINRAVIFLDTKNILFSLYIDNKENDFFKTALNQQSSLWGVNFNFNDYAFGKIDPKNEKQSLLIHKLQYSKVSIKEGSIDDIELIGWEKLNKKWADFFDRIKNNDEITSIIDDEVFEIKDNLFLIIDNKFFIRNQNKLSENVWEESKNYPESLIHYSTFINNLMNQYKGRKIFLGEVNLSLFDFIVENKRHKRIFFVIII